MLTSENSENHGARSKGTDMPTTYDSATLRLRRRTAVGQEPNCTKEVNYGNRS